MTYRIPKEIWKNLESAQSLIDDADSVLHLPKHNATRYFLYLKAWETLSIADNKFAAWAQKQQLDPKVLKDHRHKLNDSPEISYMVVGKDGNAKELSYRTGGEKAKLMQKLIYAGGSLSRAELFERGWHFDSFRNRLIGNVRLLQVTMEAVEEL